VGIPGPPRCTLDADLILKHLPMSQSGQEKMLDLVRERARQGAPLHGHPWPQLAGAKEGIVAKVVK
jgi:hypothetical protein